MITAQKKQPIVRLKSKALREIRDEQSSTKQLIPNAPFSRLVKELVDERTNSTEYRLRKDALEALQADSEAYIIDMFNECNRIALHSGRETLAVEDLRIWKSIKENNF